MLKETDKLLDPMTIYISFVTALYLLFTKKRITWNIRNQDIAQLFSSLWFFGVFAMFLTYLAGRSSEPDFDLKITAPNCWYW